MPNNLKVISFCGTLHGPQKKVIVDFMLAAYDGFDLDQILSYNLDVEREQVVADGPFGQVCREVLEWCLQEQDKVVPLLNGFIATRSRRTDLRPMLQKLHDEGAIVIEG